MEIFLPVRSDISFTMRHFCRIADRHKSFVIVVFVVYDSKSCAVQVPDLFSVLERYQYILTLSVTNHSGSVFFLREFLF